MVSMTTGQDQTTDHLARAERAALCETLLEVGPDAPTLCDPWDARMLAAHIVLRERRPDLALGILLPPLAGRLERAQRDLARHTEWLELVRTVRSGPPMWSPTRVPTIDDLVNTVEMVVHHEDALRGDGERGPRREVSARLDRAVFTALGRMASLMFRRSPVGVELLAPGHGSVLAHRAERTVRVVGGPIELLLLAYGRERVADVAFEGEEDDVAALREAPLGL